MQVRSIDEETRNRLWNALSTVYWDKMVGGVRYGVPRLSARKPMETLFHRLWHFFFKEPLDTLSDNWYAARDVVRNYFFACTWYEVCDLIEFVANNYQDEEKYMASNTSFMDMCNSIFREEVCAYQFVGGVITPNMSDEEITEIEEALEVIGTLQPVDNALERALRLFADRESPDYVNTIKESISAAETMCQLVAEKPKVPMGVALKEIKKQGKVKIHPALIEAFSKLYGYASDAPGVRHGGTAESTEDAEEARFMLVVCSAIVNYLKVKAEKAGAW